MRLISAGSLVRAQSGPVFPSQISDLRLPPVAAWEKRLRDVALCIVHGEKDTAAPIKDSQALASGTDALRFPIRFIRVIRGFKAKRKTPNVGKSRVAECSAEVLGCCCHKGRAASLAR
jgi:hypothetical protein